MFRGLRVIHHRPNWNTTPWQHTLARETQCDGVGVHSGAPVRLRLIPAAPDHGIVFRRVDLPGRPEMVARFDRVVDTALCTCLGDGAMRIATVEHLMAALAGQGVDNLVIEIDGAEVPVMDGSSAPFVALIAEAGLELQRSPRRHVRVLRPVEVRRGNKFAALLPTQDDHLTIDLAIDFDSSVIGRQSLAFALKGNAFSAELAQARTFGFAHEVEAMRARGLGRGGSLENAVVIGDDGVLNPGGLRYDDEFVRHKALDALGDLYLAGAPILGRFLGERAGHMMHIEVLKALFADEANWTLTTSTAPIALPRRKVAMGGSALAGAAAE
jgi:UDP-3-O-[3-hydroxymyristoyl] N-acetylglucosamine deacetylase